MYFGLLPILPEAHWLKAEERNWLLAKLAPERNGHELTRRSVWQVLVQPQDLDAVYGLLRRLDHHVRGDVVAAERNSLAIRTELTSRQALSRFFRS